MSAFLASLAQYPVDFTLALSSGIVALINYPLELAAALPGAVSVAVRYSLAITAAVTIWAWEVFKYPIAVFGLLGLVVYVILMIIAIAFVLSLVGLKIFLKLTTGRCKANKCLVGKTAIVTGGTFGKTPLTVFLYVDG